MNKVKIIYLQTGLYLKFWSDSYNTASKIREYLSENESSNFIANITSSENLLLRFPLWCKLNNIIEKRIILEDLEIIYE